MKACFYGFSIPGKQLMVLEIRQFSDLSALLEICQAHSSNHLSFE